jgi:hypothetical protein
MTAIVKFLLPLLIVAFCIFVWMLAQGIGQSVGNGLTEWGLR